MIGTWGQRDREYALDMARLEADGKNLDANHRQKSGYKSEQYRDIAYQAIILCAGATAILLVLTLFSGNLAYSIVSLPLVLALGVLVYRRAGAKRKLNNIQEQQLSEFERSRRKND